MLKIDDKVYFWHNVWNEWYEGIISNVIELAKDLYEYRIEHNQNEYYTRYSIDANFVTELPENTEFKGIGNSGTKLFKKN